MYIVQIRLSTSTFCNKGQAKVVNDRPINLFYQQSTTVTKLIHGDILALF